MKRLSMITAGIVLTLLLTFTISEKADAQDKIEDPDITVGIDGLVCPFCAYGANKNFKRLEEVEAVYISIDNGIADLKLKEGHTLSEEKIKKTIDDAGFEVRSVEYHNEAVRPKEDETSN